MVFNILIEDLEDGIECTLSKAADGTNLGGEANALAGRAAIDRVLERQKKWAVRNSRKSRRKHHVLHLGWRYPMQLYRLRARLLDSSFAEKNPSGQHVERESAGCPCCKGGQLCAGLYQQA